MAKIDATEPAASAAEATDPLRISITGHRPKDLVRDGTPIALTPLIDDFLQRAATRANALGLTALEVITGGALGVDQAVAERVIELGAIDGVELRSRIILPFPIEIMGRRWRDADRERLERLVAASGGAQIIADDYATWAYHARNAAMIDASSMLMAFWTGKRSGGTWSAVQYAARKGVPTWNALDEFRPVRLASSNGARGG